MRMASACDRWARVWHHDRTSAAVWVVRRADRALRYAARVNGVTDVVLTKLDVLSGWERIPVCVAYDIDGRRVDELPTTQTEFHHAAPVYAYFDGWSDDIPDARTLDKKQPGLPVVEVDQAFPLMNRSESCAGRSAADAAR